MPLAVWTPPTPQELGYYGDPLDAGGDLRVWYDPETGDVEGWYSGSLISTDPDDGVSGAMRLYFPVDHATFVGDGGFTSHTVTVEAGKRAIIRRNSDSAIVAVEEILRFQDDKAYRTRGPNAGSRVPTPSVSNPWMYLDVTA